MLISIKQVSLKEVIVKLAGVEGTGGKMMSVRGKLQIVLSVVLSVFSLIPDLVRAQEQQAGGIASPQRDPLTPYRTVGADENQLNQIRAAVKEFEDATRVRTQLTINLMRDMRNISLNPDPDEKTVLAKQDEINKAQNEQAIERTKLMLKIRSILRPDQKQQLVQLMQRGLNGGPTASGAPAPTGN